MTYPYNRIVATCGVSVFSPRHPYRKWAEQRGLLAFAEQAQNPSPPAGMSEEDARTIWLRTCTTPGADGPPEPDTPKLVSAEFSALHALRQENRLADRVHLVLIHTDTFGGEAAAVLLEALIGREFAATVRRVKVPMNVADREDLRNNLGGFMHAVAESLRGGDRQSTCFAPLGGYKVMTSLGYLAGAYLGYPTIYLHEDDQIAHMIPAVPVRIPRDELESIAPLLKRVGIACYESDLDRNDLSLIDRYSWLFDRADEIVAVNGFGRFLMQEPEYADLFRPAIQVTDAISRQFPATGNAAVALRQQLTILADKRRAGSTDADLYHERTWSRDLGDWNLYKGSSNGVLAIRVVYRWKDDVLSVATAWTSHDEYERAFPHYAVPADIDRGAWTDWTDAPSR
jgi:putative CRISPR-associated protein (TIGR02619 family)